MKYIIKCSKHEEVFGSQNSEFSFVLASFFVSPARHGEAQDMSGN